VTFAKKSDVGDVGDDIREVFTPRRRTARMQASTFGSEDHLSASRCHNRSATFNNSVLVNGLYLATGLSNFVRLAALQKRRKVSRDFTNQVTSILLFMHTYSRILDKIYCGLLTWGKSEFWRVNL